MSMVLNNSADDFNIFDDSEWDFFNCDDSFDLFGEYQDEFNNCGMSKTEKIVTGVQVGVFGTCIVGVGFYIVSGFLDYKAYSNEPTVIDASAVQYRNGDDLDSKIQIDVNRAISDYFGVFSCNLSLSSLSSYCLETSKVASCEESYRSQSAYSYDTNDCYARAIRDFSKSIKLRRVNKLVESDGKVYAYATVSIPDTSQFSEYYQSYSVDLTYHFKSNPLTLINISKYMLDLIESNAVPTRDVELEFELAKSEDRYVLVSDSILKDYCVEPYVTSISLIADILGGKIFS
jgi:hypothetical protein